MDKCTDFGVPPGRRNAARGTVLALFLPDRFVLYRLCLRMSLRILNLFGSLKDSRASFRKFSPVCGPSWYSCFTFLLRYLLRAWSETMSVGPSQFERFIGILRSELASLKDSIQEHIRATRDANEASIETQRQIPEQLSLLHVPEKEKSAAKTYRDKAHTQQVILTWVTGGAFLAAAVYAGVAYHQMCIMEKTYGEIKQQTEAALCANAMAQAALNQSKSQFITDERPYIAVKDIGTPIYANLPDAKNPTLTDHAIAWQFHITNYGKSVAHNTVYALEEIKVWPNEHFELVPGSSDLRNSPNFNGSPVPPTADNFMAVISRHGITQEEFQKAFIRDNGIAIRAVITYKDLSGNSYETGICAYHLATNVVAWCKEGNYMK